MFTNLTLRITFSSLSLSLSRVFKQYILSYERGHNAFYRSTPTSTLLRAFSLSQCCYHGARLSYLFKLNI
jgi:hypothetical protein